MAKSKGSVRMGPISLITLIVVLCLAVMAALAVSTAKATYAATERQSYSTADIYTAEGAAQEFLAAVDTQLAPVRAAGGGRAAGLEAVRSAGMNLIEGATERDVEATVQIATVEVSVGDDLVAGYYGEGEDAAAADGASDGASVEGDASTDATGEEIIDEGGVADAGTVEEIDNDGLVDAQAASATEDAAGQSDEVDGEALSATTKADITAIFTTTSGRTLTVKIVVNDACEYTILQWKTTMLWNDSASSETLWSGAGTTKE